MEYVLGVLLALSVLCDLHGYYVKSSVQPERQAEVIAFGNWVIYLARMMNVGFAMVLAFLYELQIPVRLSVIFFLGFFFAWVGSMIYLRSSSLERWLCRALGFLFYRAFPQTVVFIGQLMNFMSTAILLAYIEPRMMQGLDRNAPQDEMDGFISGRVMLVGCMTVLSLIWVESFRS